MCIRLRPFVESALDREARARGVTFSVLTRAILEVHVHEVGEHYLGYRDDDRVVMQLLRPPRVEVVLARRPELLVDNAWLREGTG